MVPACCGMVLPGTGVEEWIGMGFKDDPSWGGPVDEDEFCPPIPCGGEGGGGSSVMDFLPFFLVGAA